jgi:hypothetical protein
MPKKQPYKDRKEGWKEGGKEERKEDEGRKEGGKDVRQACKNEMKEDIYIPSLLTYIYIHMSLYSLYACLHISSFLEA